MRKIKITIDSVAYGHYKTYPYPDDNNKYYDVPYYKMLVEGTDSSGIISTTTFPVLRFGVYLNKDGSSGHKTIAKTPIVVGLRQGQRHTIRVFKDYEVHSAPSDQRGAWIITGNFYIHAGPESKDETFATAGCMEVCGPKKFNEFNNLILSLSGVTGQPNIGTFQKIASAGIIECVIKETTRPTLKLWS